MEWKYLIYGTAGYLSGSILFGYLIAKYMYHVDIVAVSDDGNPGTANAFKYAGVGAGVFSLILELGKGFVPVYFAAQNVNVESVEFAFVIIAPVLGHAYPFGHMKYGGKAIAVAFGVLLGLIPDFRPVLTLAFCYILFSVVIKIYPHLFRSIAAFLCFGIMLQMHYGSCALTLAGFGISAVVIIKHLKTYHDEKLRIKIL